MSQLDESSQSFSGARPLKRRRIEDDQEACSQLGLLRDTTFWFPDGNIILSTGTVAFRIYHGILAAQSPVFDNMLDLPQPEGAPTMDGCPILELSDSDIDLRHLLTVLFPQPAVSGAHVPQSTVEFAHISAVIRMAHKYQLEAILKKALGVLQSYYANNYHRWMARIINPLKAQPRDAIEAVFLARLTDTPSILPAALLQCAALGPAILEGYLRNGDTLVTLSQADTLVCLQTRDKLSKLDAVVLQVLAEIVSGNDTCLRPEACRAHAFKFWAAVTSGFPDYDCASLLPWTKVISLFDTHKKPRLPFCKNCSSKISWTPALTCTRNETWDRLPKFFNLVKGRAGGDSSNTQA